MSVKCILEGQKQDLSSKQDKLAGTINQLVGFNNNGDAAALTLTANAPVTAKQAGDVLTLGLEGWAAINPQLLDNAYWANLDAIINQRGVSGTISTLGYFIDRWKLVDGTVTITDSGLLLNGTIEQILETAPDGTVTASALTTDGIVTADYDAASKTFSITGSGQTFVAAKLEHGPRQTIAYQGTSGNWVFSGPLPNKALELLKCQRYYVSPYNNNNFGTMIVGPNYPAQMVAVFDVPVPVTMRVTPTITDIINRGILYYGPDKYETPGNIGVDTNHAGSVRVFITNSGSFDIGVCTWDNAKVAFSADL